jgi:hypothetical protein
MEGWIEHLLAEMANVDLSHAYVTVAYDHQIRLRIRIDVESRQVMEILITPFAETTFVASLAKFRFHDGQVRRSDEWKIDVPGNRLGRWAC